MIPEINLRGKQVKLALSEELRNIRTTKNITGDTIRTAIERRYAIWLCSQTTKGSPTETAKRYFQMTGEEVTRQVVADQLEKIKKTLLKNEMKTRAKSESRDV
ncbi:MAG: hypothetical protein H7252_05690 [Cytophaga sp.]|nr:hypothetical protein [Undibacterium sp.]